MTCVLVRNVKDNRERRRQKSFIDCRPSIGIAIGIAGLLLGCTTTVNQASSEAYPASYRQMARDYLRSTLFDPYSVRDAQISIPKMRPSFVLTDPSEGWTICFRANAKNRLGAYTGTSETVLLIRGDKVVASTEGPAPYYCGDAKFEPFPEIEEQARRR